MTQLELLESIDFGSVDSESEDNLDKKFLKTTDFEKFLIPKNALVLGAKGSGKSALFEMFSKYENEARELSNNKLDNVLLVTGTGFKDLKELTTDDITKLMMQENFDFDEVWKLYIALKIALKLGQEGYRSGDILCEFLKQTGTLSDYRILPLLKSIWGLIVGTPLSGIDIDIKGIKIQLGKKYSIDTQDLLNEINQLLEQEDKHCWILFDKIDELFANDTEKRKVCIESLFSVYLQFVQRYPRIKLKIFLRNDIWNTLNFVNKSHISDKIIKIEWDNVTLITLMMKRICINKDIRNFIIKSSGLPCEDILKKENIKMAFYTIFDNQVYKGEKEAKVIDWMTARITDGLHGIYPREMINFGNEAKQTQLSNYATNDSDNYLISGNAVREAYFEVSNKKCTTYLSEFPELKNHFERFSGCTSARHTRVDLKKLMRGLKPSGDEMIKQLYEVGILLPLGGNGVNADKFEIPKLFRSGLGMIIRGRP